MHKKKVVAAVTPTAATGDDMFEFDLNISLDILRRDDVAAVRAFGYLLLPKFDSANCLRSRTVPVGIQRVKIEALYNSVAVVADLLVTLVLLLPSLGSLPSVASQLDDNLIWLTKLADISVNVATYNV